MTILQQFPEVVILSILQSLDDYGDLVNAVNAYRWFNVTFQTHHQAIVASVLQRQLDFQCLRILGFIRWTPRLPRQGGVTFKPHREALRRHLANFFETTEPHAGPLVDSVADFEALVKFLDCLEFSIKRYRVDAMKALGWSATGHSRTSHDAAEDEYLDTRSIFENMYFRTMSPSERTRLQRAFLHHELYCACFPVITTARERVSIVNVEVQRECFISKLPTWETEELLCVHEYLMLLLKNPILRFEQEFIKSVKRLPGIVPVKMFCFPNGFTRPLLRYGVIDNLWIFSEAATPHRRRFMAHLTSFGLVKVTTTRYGSFDDAKEFIKMNTVIMRNFLIEAVHAEFQVATAIPAQNFKFRIQSPETTDTPNLGFVRVQTSLTSVAHLLRADDWGGRDYQRRRWGYVFWDQDLLRSECFEQQSLLLPRYPVRSPPGDAQEVAMGISVAERLKDLTHTCVDWDVGLRNQYGSTYMPNPADLVGNVGRTVIQAIHENQALDAETAQITEQAVSGEESAETGGDGDEGGEATEVDLYGMSDQDT